MTMFAKGLVAGTIQAPARTSWWPRHTRSIMRFLSISGSKMSPSFRLEVCGGLHSGAKEWEALCPKAAQHGLMIEHVGLEMSLVDAIQKVEVDSIEAIGKKLFENTTEMAAVLGIAIVEFPEDQFKRLFMEHVKLFTVSVRKKVEGVVATGSEIESNTLKLADFTSEWL